MRTPLYVQIALTLKQYMTSAPSTEFRYKHKIDCLIDNYFPIGNGFARTALLYEASTNQNNGQNLVFIFNYGHIISNDGTRGTVNYRLVVYPDLAKGFRLRICRTGQYSPVPRVFTTEDMPFFYQTFDKALRQLMPCEDHEDCRNHPEIGEVCPGFY